jgi:hypothetical protein
MGESFLTQERRMNKEGKLFNAELTDSPENFFLRYQEEINTCTHALMGHGLSDTFFETVLFKIGKITGSAPTKQLFIELTGSYKATRIALTQLGTFECIKGDWYPFGRLVRASYDHRRLAKLYYAEYKNLRMHPHS